MRQFSTRVMAVFASRWFFYGVMALFVFQAVWIALSSAFPMAFDEDFHLGVIKIYAGGLSPFLHTQPDGADRFGSLVHDPSYLYHYLMSFPYRVLTWLTDNEAARVLVLRAINIALCAWSIVLFRKVLRRAGASPALAHVCLALFVLVPIVSMVAGQISYDNMILVVTPLLLLAGFDILDGLQARQVRLLPVVYFVLLVLTGSLVKYTVLPMVAAGVVWIAYKTWRAFRGRWPVAWVSVREQFGSVALGRKLWLGACLVVLLCLFGQRYAVNLALYQNPVPDCDDSLSEDRCMAFGPWARNTTLAATKSDDGRDGALSFVQPWVYGMWFRTFFTLSGPNNDYATRRPLPVPAWTALSLAFLATLAALIFWRRVFRGRAYMGYLLAIILLYVAMLWVDQYGQYRETGQPVAINGRYLLPLLPVMLYIWGLGLMALLRRQRLPISIAACAVVTAMAYGGGIAVFIVRSDASWYWHNSAVQRTNEAARHMLRPILIEGKPS